MGIVRGSLDTRVSGQDFFPLEDIFKDLPIPSLGIPFKRGDGLSQWKGRSKRISYKIYESRVRALHGFHPKIFFRGGKRVA